MKAIQLTILLSCSILGAFAQDLPGFRTSNYNGVIGVFTNPANAAQNNYAWDVNFFSMGLNLGNNNASFSLKNMSKLTEGDSVINQLIGKPGQSSSALFGADIKPISVLIGLNRKNGIALTTRTRVLFNTTDVDGSLAKQIADQGSNGNFPYSISSDKDMRITGNAWAEVGFTYGRVLMDKGKHFIKVGVTGKYLAGVANAFVNIDKLKGTLNQDPATQDVYLKDASGSLEIGMGGVSFNDFDAKELTSFKSTGIGADLGLIYEYRPEQKKYKYRIGVALTDIGSIKYDKDLNKSGGYSIHTGNPGLNLEELDVPADKIKDYLDSKPAYFTPINSGGNTYSVSLPTMLNLDLDYQVKGKLYVNAAGHFNMASKANPFNGRLYDSYSVTPRLETKLFGIYVPVNYSELTDLNAGVAVKVGPLFLGSGSVLTALLSESKQADFYFGIRFGGFAK